LLLMAQGRVGRLRAGRQGLAAALASLLALASSGGSLAAQSAAPPADAEPPATPAATESPTAAAAPAAASVADSRPIPPGLEPSPHSCTDPETRATTIRCFPRLLLHDTGEVFRAPTHWRARQWTLFSAEVLGVAALSLADKHIHKEVVPRVGHQAGRLAQ